MLKFPPVAVPVPTTELFLYIFTVEPACAVPTILILSALIVCAVVVITGDASTVVKLKLYAEFPFPAQSLTAFTGTTTLYVVPHASVGDTVSVLSLTLPLTLLPFNVIDALPGCKSSLNVITICELVFTPTALFAGTVLLTVGSVASV